MSNLILQQAREIFVMFCGGILIGCLHQILEIYQGRARQTAGVRLFQDLLFWLFAGLLLASFLYYSSFGRITFHGLLGGFAGFLLWFTVLSQIFHLLLRWFYGIIKR